jgi:hypothetical protein
MSALYREIFNRGHAKPEFVADLLLFAKTADQSIFAINTNYDIYSKIATELGPWKSDLHRCAVMLEVLSVLALFESQQNHHEGIDVSRHGETTSENAEAGAWQESWNARHLDPSLNEFVHSNGVTNGTAFQQRVKADHMFSTEFTARLLRIDIHDFHRIANGPVRKGDERKRTWPDRPKLWRPEESIYPWLSRDAVSEFEKLLT